MVGFDHETVRGPAPSIPSRHQIRAFWAGEGTQVLSEGAVNTQSLHRRGRFAFLAQAVGGITAGHGHIRLLVALASERRAFCLGVRGNFNLYRPEKHCPLFRRLPPTVAEGGPGNHPT